jgi:hypothetical protein
MDSDLDDYNAEEEEIIDLGDDIQPFSMSFKPLDSEAKSKPPYHNESKASSSKHHKHKYEDFEDDEEAPIVLVD